MYKKEQPFTEKYKKTYYLWDYVIIYSISKKGTVRKKFGSGSLEAHIFVSYILFLFYRFLPMLKKWW